MTDTRTDIHRPSAVDPADYIELDGFYQGASQYMAEGYMSADPIGALRRLLDDKTASIKDRLEPSGNFSAKYSCDHCGAGFCHGVYYLHVPTGRVIAVGHTCANNTFGTPTRAALLRKRAERTAAAARKTAKTKAEAEAWQVEHPEALAHLERFAPTNSFYADLLRKLTQYGSLTEGQLAAVERNMAKDVERAESRETQAAEWAAIKRPIPELFSNTRATITGTVLSLKDTYNDFGPVTKMLVLDDHNFKVWGTCPRAIIDDVDRGSRVTFAAAIKISDDDESFGFFSRPTSATLVTAEADTTHDTSKETA